MEVVDDLIGDLSIAAAAEEPELEEASAAEEKIGGEVEFAEEILGEVEFAEEILDEATALFRHEVYGALLLRDPLFEAVRNTYKAERPDCEILEIAADLVPISALHAHLDVDFDFENHCFAGFQEIFDCDFNDGKSPEHSAMSLQRRPDPLATDNLRGRQGNTPFMPGGLEEKLYEVVRSAEVGDPTADVDSASFDFEKLLNVFPGRTDEIKLVDDGESSEEDKLEKSEAESSEKKMDFDDILNILGGTSELPVVEETSEESSDNSQEEVDTEEAEEEKVEPTSGLEDAHASDEEELGKPVSPEYEFARIVNPKVSEKRFEEIRPVMAAKYPFELDQFQKDAVVCMEARESVFVAAHTSSGKTAVAQYAVAMSMAEMKRAIYTSPIKALSNQKFHELRSQFKDVGLVTGDIQINTKASCIVMTTEILRSMLYNGSEAIRELEWVIFDEVHYINDDERGYVWEEIIIMLPADVKIVMLSATAPNCVEFADWVGRVKNRNIYVIQTAKRPVPLEHYLYTGQNQKSRDNIFKILDANGIFMESGYNDANTAIQNRKVFKPKAPQGGPGGFQGSFNNNSNQGPRNNQQRGGNGRFGNSGGGQRSFNQSGGGQRSFNQSGGSQRSFNQSGGGQRSFNQSGAGGNRPKAMRSSPTMERNLYTNVIRHFLDRDMLPMVAFVFSRQRCNDYAMMLRSMDLTSGREKGEIHKFFSHCIDRLRGNDKELPQVMQMRELCIRGFGLHHSGVLPCLKETVERLFQDGLIKVLFATETFAMGVNMPARTVVFDSITKHDGKSRRVLNATEYIQMAGRAGRRGLDATGTVVILCRDTPSQIDLRAMLMGKPVSLKSSFRVTYHMILNLLRVNHLRIEDMLQRSYVENVSLRLSGSRKEKLDHLRQRLELMTVVNCRACYPPDDEELQISNYVKDMSEYIQLRNAVFSTVTRSAGMAKHLTPGRVVIVNYGPLDLYGRIAVILKVHTSDTGKPLINFLALADAKVKTTAKEMREKFMRLTREQQEAEVSTQRLVQAMTYGPEALSESFEVSDSSYYLVEDEDPSVLVAVCQGNVKQMDVKGIYDDYRQMCNYVSFKPRIMERNVAKVVSKLASLMRSPPQVLLLGRDIHITDLDGFELIENMAKKRHDIMQENRQGFRTCAFMQKHIEHACQAAAIRNEENNVAFQMSENNLILINDYDKKINVLRALNFISSSNVVQLKGRVAGEINTMELFITELILENKFAHRTAAEMACLLSACITQYKSNQKADPFPDLDYSLITELKEDAESIMMKISQVRREAGLSHGEDFEELHFDLMDVVYEWAKGTESSCDVCNGSMRSARTFVVLQS
ncbi:hypothetical protein L596_008418 [Steinernema carpocapsae]|uniref:Helicase SKI2W n=1 Tax=Steinernema carpocapsae TaxID=34508 RepID=A0A4U5PCY4_STECR|nr:hypothetical protein L596_008418 [Steinernema carpocapsae]